MPTTKKLIFNPATAEIELQSVAETIGIEGRVTTFATLPTASTNAGAVYLVEQDTGSILLFNKREAGLYRSNGTAWIEFNDVAAENIEINNSTLGAPQANVQSALDFLATATGAGLSWNDYATRWDVAPTLNKAITGGNVFNYTLGGTTRYRFVPSPYTSTQDIFYSNFNDSTDVLSGAIIGRDS